MTDASKGYLIEIDHWNSTTSKKDTRLKYCDRFGEEVKDEKCEVVARKVSTILIKS